MPAPSGTDNPFYAREDVAERYDLARSLPGDVEREWSDVLARHALFAPGVCVDLGCGTGRFTRILASTFGGRVIGIDPSRPMLRAAADALRGTPGVTLLHGRAESIPLAPDSVDFVLMSMSYHHVPDKPAALASVRRTLRTGGVLCVRTCSLEALDSYLYQRFFPEARAFNERRFPSRDGVVGEVRSAGFALHRFESIRQRVAESLASYREKTAHRGHSDLQALGDDQFEQGMKRFDEWLATQADRPVFEEVDVFTFSAV